MIEYDAVAPEPHIALDPRDLLMDIARGVDEDRVRRNRVEERAMQSERDMLRHLIATVRYRAENSFRAAPESFAATRAGDTHWTALETLSHMSDVLEWGTSIAAGNQVWSTNEPVDWSAEVDRFHAALDTFDACLANGDPACPTERLVQGPLADVLTHVGQLASLRRSCGVPVEPENYFQAEIAVGTGRRAE